jgi:lysyl-tRNA synthetase class 2
MEDWRPTAPLEHLWARARILADLRAFFAERGVLEVETPLLAAATVPDLHLDSIACTPGDAGSPPPGYLQTSPEYAMKRLLAAGSGPIYQITKAFRAGEAGPRHNPEFTLLEWYRPGWDHHALMDEVDALLARVLGAATAERVTYGQAFARTAGVDPHRAPVAELAAAARARGLDPPPGLDRDGLLDFLLTMVVEPTLGQGQPTFLHDFPASQAALARVRPGDPPVAERFEVFSAGLELANGFHELTDATEQRRRFDRDRAHRHAAGRPVPALDERFLAALAAGLPPCAGVALGVDRLVMRAVAAVSIDEVMAFPSTRA